MNHHIKLEASWKQALAHEFEKDYMQTLRAFLLQERQVGKIIYPHFSQIFHALNLTPLTHVNVVILGQDPYHGDNQAHGLSFSVPPHIKIPPSLLNIYKELSHDLNIPPAPHGYLAHWAEQGVLLLNSVLTVEQHQAGSHQNKGWERFTDCIIDTINQTTEHTVFILWGSYAQKKGANIDADKHLILQAPHPSPLSAHRGFFGGCYFSKSNNYLKQHHKAEINWTLPNTNTAITAYQSLLNKNI